MQLLVFLVLFVIDSLGQMLEKSRSVWVEQGLVRGKIYNIDGRHIQIFRGIPYAEPPIGSLRFQFIRKAQVTFQKPVKKSRWHQELSAVEYGPPCIQFMDFHRYDKYSAENMKRQSEDCLYLNVFSPYVGDLHFVVLKLLFNEREETDQFLPSPPFHLFFLISEQYHIQKPATMSFAGFLNMRSGDKVEGNFGIWDQVMALKWIQANIKQFGGDPTRVTLMGESAGGAACSLLAVSPRTQEELAVANFAGLAQQAIIMSGSATAGWAIHRHGTPAWSVENFVSYLRCEKTMSSDYTREVIGDEYTPELLKAMKCNYQTELVSCLNDDQKPEEQMDCLRKEINFTSLLFRKTLAVELGVSKMVVDGDLIPTSGVDLVRNYARIPIMTGVARKEWAHKKPQFYNLHRKSTLTAEESAESVFRIVEGSFHDTSATKLSNSTLYLVANASFVRYIDDPTNTFETSRVVSALQMMEADIEFVAPCQREIDAYVQNNLTVYAYSFDYIPESPIFEEEKKVFDLFGKDPVTIVRKDQTLKDRKIEAFHGLDHAFIFSRGYSSNFEIRPFTKRDESMAKILTNMVTNFAKSGDPSTKRFTWPQFSGNNTTEHISIDLPPKVIQGELHWPNPKFWNVEAELISRHVSAIGDTVVDPDADLSNEERVQLSAYRRAWWALWLLVAVLAIVIWGIVIYAVVSKGSSPRNKPYDNIVITR
ncbi:Carboxylesterase [Necator americanus]|uniref:Carboxylesterase n=1 Tax=Necator americanus TaxID=51031 RepID=W2SXL2_NECAM|nr:Carboxylesterase [Necator americanus]ETN74370.1 Carboxylesterase [Necator americanus]